MNTYLKSVPVLVLLLSGSVAMAQTKQDSVIKEMALKEVHIHTTRKSKHPRTDFYQSSMLSGIDDILAKVEGLSLIKRGPIGMEPILRGFSGGQVNVVIDGMKIFGACTDKMDPATIYTEPVNLKNIEVRYGGEGMAMGATVGGTLNLKLADARIDSNARLTGSIASGYYSAAAAVQNVLAINYSADRWAVRVSSVYRKADDYRDGMGRQVAFSQYEKVNTSVSGKYRLTKNSIIKADFLLDDGWNIGFPALPMDVGYAKARITSFTYERKVQTNLVQEIEAKVYANSVRHAMDDTHRPAVTMHMDMPGKSHTIGAFAQFRLRPQGKHLLKLKTDFYYNSVKADMTMYPQGGAPMYMRTWPENDQKVAGLYVEDGIFLNDKSRLDLKLRVELASSKIVDQIGKNQFEVLGYEVQEPLNRVLKNVNVSYTRFLSPVFTVYLSTGLNERSATTSERFGFYLFNRMDNHDYVGNPLLKNEQAWNSEVNLLFATKELSWKLSAFGSLVQHYIMGKIQPSLSVMTSGASGVRAYENIPSAKLFGAESSFNYQFFHQHFVLNNTWKWLQGKDGQNQPLPLIAPIKTITSLRFRHRQLSFQAENEISLKQSRINLNFGEKETPAYAVFNVRSDYSFVMKRYQLNFSAGVENLFNKAYTEHLDWGSVLRPGRNIYSMLTLKF